MSVTIQSAMYKIVDTLANLSFGAPHGQIAFVQDDGSFWYWSGTQWLPFGSSGSAIRPNSFHNRRITPSVYDDEFESPTLNASWTRTVSGGTAIGTGTVHPVVTNTADCIEDLDNTWPSWLLVQSDETSNETITYSKDWTATTDATFMVGVHFSSYSGALTTGENAIRIKLTNSADADEWVYAAIESVAASGRHLRLQVNNAGVLTTRTSGTYLGAYTGLESSCLVLFKESDVYYAVVAGDYGAYMYDFSAPVTKTGVTTFDTANIELTTDNRTPSPILGVDYFRVYNTSTWALKNP